MPKQVRDKKFSKAANNYLCTYNKCPKIARHFANQGAPQCQAKINDGKCYNNNHKAVHLEAFVKVMHKKVKNYTAGDAQKDGAEHYNGYINAVEVVKLGDGPVDKYKNEVGGSGGNTREQTTQHASGEVALLIIVIHMAYFSVNNQV